MSKLQCKRSSTHKVEAFKGIVSLQFFYQVKGFGAELRMGLYAASKKSDFKKNREKSFMRCVSWALQSMVSRIFCSP